MSGPRDRRLTPARADLAAASLRGQVEAPRYAEGILRQVEVGVAPLRRAPGISAMLDTELLFGERVWVYDVADGWAWGQSETDGYVGYVPAAALGIVGPVATHRVAALATHVYSAADIKAPGPLWLSAGSRLAVQAIGDRFASVTALGREGFVPLRAIVPVADHALDFVTEAERFKGVPYLWGGRSSAGLDCSSLVQLSLAACGIAAPRDSDMQERGLGTPVVADPAALARGDLVFWKGHVAIALGDGRMVHANATAMAVSVDDIASFAAKIAPKDGPITNVRRLAVRA